MRKLALLAALFLAVMGLLGVLTGCSGLTPGLGSKPAPAASLPSVSTIDVGSIRLQVVATFADKAAREHGLMGRTIAPGQAGLFTFGGASSTDLFWMLDTPQALSLLWVSGGRVVGTVEMPVCKLSCPKYSAPAAYDVAVEAAAGTFARVKPGSVVSFA